LIDLPRSIQGKSLCFDAVSATARVGIEGDILYGEKSDLIEHDIKGDLSRVVVGSALLAVGLILMAAFTAFRKNRDILYLSCLSILAGLWAWSMCSRTTLGLSPLSVDDFWGPAIYWSTYLALPFLLKFSESFSDRKSLVIKMHHYLFCCSTSFFFVACSFSLFRIMPLRSFNQAFNFMAMGIMSALIISHILAFLSGARNAGILAFAIVGFAAFAVGDTLGYLHFLNVGSEVPSGHIGAVFLVVAMMIVLAHRLQLSWFRSKIRQQALRDKNHKLAETRDLLYVAERRGVAAQMTQMLAHDVRKPFSLFRMSLDVLTSARTPEQLKKSLASVIPQIDRALVSVDGLIADVMEVGSPVSDLILEHVSPQSLVESTLGDTFRVYPNASVAMTYDFGHTHMANVHVQKVARVFSNIVGNAIQAMKGNGSLWFRTREVDGFIEFCLGNSCSVISPESLAKLFDAFFTRGKKGGTGLGLAIAQKVVQAHGGRIWCESGVSLEHPSGRVEFFFTLPVAKSAICKTTAILPVHSSEIIKALAAFTPGKSNTEDDALLDERESSLEAAIVAARTQTGRPLRVLIVDDESIYRSALALSLHRAPEMVGAVTVEEAPDALSALSLARSHSFDIIITDVDMRRDSMDGFELVGELRAIGCNALICVHSNRIVAEDHKTAIMAGADAFLPKPMARAQLLRLVLQSVQVTTPEAELSEKSTEISTEASTPEVMVVDDSVIVLESWERVLAKEAKVHTVESLDHLLQYLAADPALICRLGCVVTDMHLGHGEASGIDVGRKVKELNAALPVILSSDGIFSPDELAGCIDKVIAKKAVSIAALLG
jgi:signal transduction histidine kinase/DNA-binding NarL/FixJ family response regulator